MIRRRPGRFVRAAAACAVLGLVVTACDSQPKTTPAPHEQPSPVVESTCARTLTRSTSGTIQTPELDESSGLAASAKNPGTLWINNDSGDSARVFAVAPDGSTQGIYPFEGASAIDWEDIAIGPGPVAKTPYLYAGDIGDNGSVRPDIVIYRVRRAERRR